MKLRNVLVTLALAILLLVGYLAVRGTDSAGEPLPQTWPSFAHDDVSALVLTLKGADPGTLQLRRSPGSSDRWELQRGTSWIPAKSATVDDLLRALARQGVERRFEREDLTLPDIAEYSLDAPVATAELTLPSGPLELRYGRKTAAATGIYCDGGDGTDVWIAEDGPFLALQALFVTDPVDVRLFDLLASHDVQGVRAAREGTAILTATKDQDYIWNVLEPYAGHADPTPFGRMIATLVNAQLEWAEFDAPDLVKYGLDEPRMELGLTDRDGKEWKVLVGSPVDPAKPTGASYVLKPGTQHVGVASARFVATLLADPQEFRDRSFTRLGIDGVRILVKSEQVTYQLESSGVQIWDISKPPPRTPTDGATIKTLLEELRSWEILAFEDDAKPEDQGLGGDDGVVVEIERRDGSLIQLEFGKPSGEDGVYARRGKDGTVVVVGRAVLAKLLAGPDQFRTKVVRNFAVEDIEELRRVVRDENLDKIPDFVIQRDLESDSGAHWVPTGPGVTGSFDRAAVERIIARLRALQTIRWVAYDPGKAESYGFDQLGGTWFDIQIGHVDRGMEPEGGVDQWLMIGNKAPGGRFARFRSSPQDPLFKYAFILSDEVVEALVQPVFKITPRRDEEVTPPDETEK